MPAGRRREKDYILIKMFLSSFVKVAKSHSYPRKINCRFEIVCTLNFMHLFLSKIHVAENFCKLDPSI